MNDLPEFIGVMYENKNEEIRYQSYLHTIGHTDLSYAEFKKSISEKSKKQTEIESMGVEGEELESFIEDFFEKGGN